MKRKEFLKKASSGVLAATVLPLLSFNKKREIEEYEMDEYLCNDYLFFTNQKIKFALEISPDIYGNGPHSLDKIITLNSQSTIYEICYDVRSRAKKIIDGQDGFKILCKFKPEKSYVPDEFKIEHGSLTNYITIYLIPRHSLTVDFENKYKYLFKYTKTVKKGFDMNAYDCFLTSACVFHKGLADDCKELTVLRNLRATKMNPNLEYQKLIAEYEIVAPQMLLNINKAENKNEILDVIYNQLVLPSVALVEKGKEDEAIKYYADFVQEMKMLYL